jgi:hypothetical protein
VTPSPAVEQGALTAETGSLLADCSRFETAGAGQLEARLEHVEAAEGMPISDQASRTQGNGGNAMNCMIEIN